jgi:RNase adaptor protein for sRNA GlmZ degradation
MIYQDIQNMLDTTDLLKYDIQIGEQIFSATNKEAQFTMWSEAATHGLPVPLEMLIELSSLPNKGKWNKIVKEQESMRQQMEQMKYTAELQKAGRIPVNPTNEEPR